MSGVVWDDILFKLLYLRNGSSEDSDSWPSCCPFNELSNKLTETPIKQLQCVNCDVQNKPLCLTAFYVHEKDIMVFNGEINPSKRAYIKYLTQGKKLSIKDIARQCRVSRATVYRLKKDETIDRDQRKECNRDFGGRPHKLSLREERHILRTLSSLRHEEGNFTSIRLMARAGISPKTREQQNNQAIPSKGRLLFPPSKEKGPSLRKGLKRTRKIRQKYQKTLLKGCVEGQCSFFFLDCVSFWYKRNPADQASAPHGRIWCKKCERLMRGCTSKGGKVGSGGKVVKVIVAISYGKGAIVCHQYDKLDGAHFAKFVRDNFENMFRLTSKNGSRLFVQDNCPVQNSSLARRALRDKKAKQLKLPPRSGDIHCIENFFHAVKVELDKQALELNITRETYEEFSERVIRTIKNMPVDVVDKIIESMDNRISLVLSSKGQRTKY